MHIIAPLMSAAMAVVGAFAPGEVRTGCASLTVDGLNGSAVVVGLLVSPARVWRAPKSAKGQRTLYRDDL